MLIRLASVPAGHPFVRATTDPGLVALLPDPVPPGATLAGQWWPPRWLDPGYLREHIHEIDVLHVHFGFEAVALGDLRAVTGLLRAHRVPLVVTVHDLANPHLADQTTHEAALGLLLSEAGTVITLTRGAARVIAQRWGVESVVLPHPHLLPVECVGVRRATRAAPVVAVHAKFLRANVDPWPIMDALVATEWAAAPVALRLDMDENALRSRRADEALPDRLAAYDAAGVDVRVHPPFADAELVDYLHEIDVMVLPYRFGTHSGWVEACFDAGVLSVVPDCGFFDEQHASGTFVFGPGRFDPAGLRRTVEDAASAVRAAHGFEDRARRDRRVRERSVVRDHVADIYRRALAARNAA
ncbi:glycosyltransferase [Mycobacterium sp. pW049]|uniref:glycosyltransferase n=1 Tax=[Mycobacterium] bulgaricum TaxID=3238985 RepID=UPI00351B676B